MNEAQQQVQALIQSLQQQRNGALNALANTEAALTVANARIQELQKQQQEPGSLAPVGDPA